MPINISTQLKTYWLPILISSIALIIAISGKDASNLLQYDSNAIENGEWWRMITAHFVHLSWSHLWLNLAGLVLVFAFFGKCVSSLFWLMSTILSATGISLLIYYLNPEIIWYVGLSGVLHCLFVIGGIADIQFRKWEGIGFTSIIFAKISYEQFAGALPGSEEAAGGPVLVDAHFYGALIGLILAFRFIPTLKRHLLSKNGT